MVQQENNKPTCFEGSQCITCGYDIRGLELDGSCPECGTAIELSMRGDRLSQSDPTWVAKLARGQSLLVLGLKIFLLAIVIGFACLIIGFAIPLVSIFVFRSGTGVAAPSWLFSVGFTINGIGIFIGVVIATIGCALVTTQDPRDSLSESKISNRKVARWANYAIYVCVVCSAALALVLDLFVTSNIMGKIYGYLVLFLFGICLIVTFVASLRWLASLAVRIPDHGLRKRTLKSSRFFQWAILVFVILNIITTAIRPAPLPGAPVGSLLSGPNIWFDLVSCSSIILVIAILFNSIQLYLILREYRSAFRKCAAEAAAAITNSS